jgi:hypothetical protein
MRVNGQKCCPDVFTGLTFFTEKRAGTGCDKPISPEIDLDPVCHCAFDFACNRGICRIGGDENPVVCKIRKPTGTNSLVKIVG